MTTVSSLVNSAATTAKRSRWYSYALGHNPLIQRWMNHHADHYRSATAEQRAEQRAELLQRTLDWAARTPYGIELGRKAGDDIAQWPILEKSRLKAAPSQFHRPGRRPAVSATTGGTTGSPLALRRSLISLNAERYFLDSLLRPYGVSFTGSRMAVLRGDSVKDPSITEPPFGRYDHSGRHLVLSSQHLQATTIEWFRDELFKFSPSFLWAHPATLSSLVRLIDRAGLELSIPLIVTSSEMLSPKEAEMAAGLLDAKMVDYYGQAERVSLAANHDGTGYRFVPLYGTVELQPAGEAADGLAVAEVVATGHWNSTMPLVRYLVGDTIAYRSSGSPHQLERIATGEEPFERVQGRTGDFLVSPSGGVLVGISHLARGLTGVVRMQVRQESPTDVRILVIADGEFTADDRAALDENCKSRLPSSMTVSIEQVDELPRTAAGKTPFVVRADGLEPTA